MSAENEAKEAEAAAKSQEQVRCCYSACHFIYSFFVVRPRLLVRSRAPLDVGMLLVSIDFVSRCLLSVRPRSLSPDVGILFCVAQLG